MPRANAENIWLCKDRSLPLDRTLIMGILNVTPDSFSDGGLFINAEAAVRHAIQMVHDGADIIDIGGESTRPGSGPVFLEEELERVIPVIRKLNDVSDIPISIDTYKSEVAEEALMAGACIVNDISGFSFDPHMAQTVAEFKAAAVLMHIRGNPKEMQVDIHYSDLMGEIKAFLNASIQKALAAGIHKKSIVVDPGIGFGKEICHNFEIIRHLPSLLDLGYPVMIGPSRKSFIGKTLQLPADERIEGTIAAVTAGILNGASIVRVHDVKAVKRAVIIADKIAGKN